jgi:predicted nucleotidyltransferase
MVKKKTTKKKKTKKPSKKINIKQKLAELDKKTVVKAKKAVKKAAKNIPTLKLKREHNIAMDFALKVYEKFEKSVKSIVLFGSTVKQSAVVGSDVDIIIIIDDVSIKWDQEMIAWYREELDKILKANPYQKALHINTIKLSTWWEDLLKGDPIVINVLRYGEALIDLGGFFEPLKFLLIQGKIKPTPEAVYNALQRAPLHLERSRQAELGCIEGLYWTVVDAAQAALIAASVSPPSPEHIPIDLKQTFVDTGMLNKKYVAWYRDLLILHKKILHGEIRELKGIEIDDWQERADEFLKVMINLVKDIIS